MPRPHVHLGWRSSGTASGRWACTSSGFEALGLHQLRDLEELLPEDLVELPLPLLQVVF